MCDLFLMKVWLKKEVCGAREQCTGPTLKMLDICAIQTFTKCTNFTHIDEYKISSFMPNILYCSHETILFCSPPPPQKKKKRYLNAK